MVRETIQLVQSLIALALSLLALLSLMGCGGREDVPSPLPESSGGVSEAPPESGRWHRVPGRPAETLDDKQQREMERLEAIGYLSGSREAVSETGVTVHQRALAGKGYNLYTSGHGPEAVLIDMDGRELHRWRLPFHEAWPPERADGGRGKEREAAAGMKKQRGARPDADVQYWRNAHLFPNGDLLAIFEGQGLIKLDKASNLIWASRCGAHHDLDLLDNGDILVLTREARINPLISEEKPVLEDYIVTLDAASGRENGRVSLLGAFSRAPRFEELWRSSENEVGDIFHTNTLFLMHDPPPGVPPAFTAGRVLTSMKSLDVVAVVDLEEELVVWARSGRFKAQHDPRLLPNGNLLLFDNLGVPARSRVLEFDLKTWRPVWSYIGVPERPFFSETCGTSQRLGNGNTLITESDGGRAFEVTPDGEIVWEFFNPHRAGDRDQFIASLFTVNRLDSGFPLDWIDRSPP